LLFGYFRLLIMWRIGRAGPPLPSPIEHIPIAAPAMATDHLVDCALHVDSAILFQVEVPNGMARTPYPAEFHARVFRPVIARRRTEHAVWANS
jgi:hypothetical protein